MVKNCAPFTKKRGPVGCLLIHGFTGCPYEMRSLGSFLSRNGITVRGLCLPGHGTTPEDLAKVTWLDWVACVEKEYLTLRKACRKVFVAGLSMGGALALHLAAKYQPDGVITYAAPVYRGTYHDPRIFWLPLLQYFQKWGPPVGGDIQHKGVLTVAYEKTPIKGFINFFKLLRQVRAILPGVYSPLLAFHARVDHTVSPENANILVSSVGSSQKELIWLEHSYHLVTQDYDQKLVFDKTLQFIRCTARK